MDTGYLILFTLMEVLTLPLIFARAPLHVLVYIMGALMLCLFAIGLYRRRKSLSHPLEKCLSLMRKKSLLFWVTLGLILFQTAFLCVMTHLDADDSFYVGAAVTDAATDTIFQYSPYTGFLYKVLPKRYTLSPMPVFTAVISKLCLGLHPSVLAHMLLPPFFFWIVVSVEKRYAKLFFPKEERYQLWFLFFCHVLLQFSSWSIYNSGNFTMIRLWQGKALLTAAFLPLTVYEGIFLLLKPGEEMTGGGYWPFLRFLLCVISNAFLSSMGILLSPVVVGIFFLLSLLQRDTRKATGFLLCGLPSVVLGALYLILW